MDERVHTCIQVYVKCSEPRYLGEASLSLGDLVVGQTLFLAPHLLT